MLINGALYLLQYRGHTSGVAVNLGAGFDLIGNMPGVTEVRHGLESALPEVPGATPPFPCSRFRSG